MPAAGYQLTGAKALMPERPITHIVPLPYSSNIEIDGTHELAARLTVPSRMALDGAAATWERHPDAKIVLVGETDYAGLPNTTDLMAERAQETFAIPAGALVLLHSSSKGQALNNTYQQMDGLARYFRGVDAARILLEPLGFHQPRVAHTAEAYGLRAETVTTEDVLLAAGGLSEYEAYLPLLDNLEKLERIKKFAGHNHGSIFNFIMRFTGPNLLDIVETDAGYRLEQGFARAKQRRLQRELAAAQTQIA